MSRMIDTWCEENGCRKISARDIPMFHEKVYDILLKKNNFINPTKKYQFYLFNLDIINKSSGKISNIAINRQGELFFSNKLTRKTDSYFVEFSTNIGNLGILEIDKIINSNGFFIRNKCNENFMTDSKKYTVSIDTTCGICRRLTFRSFQSCSEENFCINTFIRHIIIFVDKVKNKHHNIQTGY